MKRTHSRPRFLVLVDFSPLSEALLRFAVEWSAWCDAEVVLGHSAAAAVPAMASSEGRAQVAAAAMQEAERKLEALAGRVLPPGAAVSYAVSERPLVQHAQALLRDSRDNLVFLALKGTGAMKQLFLGSEAVRIVNALDDPIVAMPRHAACCGIDQLHVAVQRDHPLNIVSFDRFLKFTADRIKRISFFSVLSPEDDFTATKKYVLDLADRYAGQRETSVRLLRSGDVATELKHVLSGEKREFVAVQKGSRMFLDQLLRKLVIEDLVHEGETPIVVLS